MKRKRFIENHEKDPPTSPHNSSHLQYFQYVADNYAPNEHDLPLRLPSAQVAGGHRQALPAQMGTWATQCRDQPRAVQQLLMLYSLPRSGICRLPAAQYTIVLYAC